MEMTLLLNASTELMDIEEAHLRFAPRHHGDGGASWGDGGGPV